MYAIPAFSPQYLIINRDQEAWTYNGLEDAVLALGRAAREQGFVLSNILVARFSYKTRVDLSGARYIERVGHIIVRTSLGDVVSRKPVLDLFYRLQARPGPADDACRSGLWPDIRRRRGHRGPPSASFAPSRPCDPNAPFVLWIGMNPSVAGFDVDDPTAVREQISPAAGVTRLLSDAMSWTTV